jgi:hypothetical protein
MKIIHENRYYRTCYDEDGHLVQIDLWGEKRHRLSRKTWPDVESAEKAFGDGLVNWDEWMDD